MRRGKAVGSPVGSQHYQEDLAYIHHVGFSDLARRAAPWVLAALRKADIHEGTVVELGCGSGILLAALSAVGYQTVGIDASAAILDIAASTAPGATLVHASAYDAVIPPCRAIIAMGEPFNYVSGPGSEPPTAHLFSQATAALPAGGLLLFDAMIRNRTDFTPFRSWATGSDWACLFDSLPDADGRHLRRAITTFRLVGDTYRRGDEEHWVHLFSRTLLTRQLKKAGFTVRTASAYGRVRLSPGRRLFHCRRASA